MKTKDLLLHPKTYDEVAAYLEHPAAALALIGPEGSGKRLLSEHLAAKLGASSLERMIDHGELIILNNDDQFGIDMIRQLIKSLSIKPNSARFDHRIILIQDAERLGQEAQNALLKTLEQPPTPTYFIFTVSSPRGLLPTVNSRLSQLQVRSVGLQEAIHYYQDKYELDQINQAWQISSGRIGFMSMLLAGKSDTRNSIELAKQFLGASRFDRLILLNDVSSSRETFIGFLDGLSIVLRALSHSQIEKGNLRSADKVTLARRLIMDINTKVKQNASVKLAALKLVTDITI